MTIDRLYRIFVYNTSMDFLRDTIRTVGEGEHALRYALPHGGVAIAGHLEALCSTTEFDIEDYLNDTNANAPTALPATPELSGLIFQLAIRDPKIVLSDILPPLFAHAIFKNQLRIAAHLAVPVTPPQAVVSATYLHADLMPLGENPGGPEQFLLLLSPGITLDHSQIEPLAPAIMEWFNK